jgi:hypothetical protein|tara:strand:- start:34811 stop:35137 length:327 start_codon:yes stop_codon:yes gene_type:complete
MTMPLPTTSTGCDLDNAEPPLRNVVSITLIKLPRLHHLQPQFEPAPGLVGTPRWHRRLQLARVGLGGACKHCVDRYRSILALADVVAFMQHVSFIRQSWTSGAALSLG